MSFSFSDIINQQISSSDVKYINRVPKIQVEQYFNKSTNDKNILLIPISKYDEINSRELSTYQLNQQKLFYVSIAHLTTLINEIINTNGKYTYPMVFVNFLKSTFRLTDKVSFSEKMLLYLRIWSNQIREICNKSNITEYIYSPTSTDPLSSITFIGYQICCELLYYHKFGTN